MRSPRNPVRFTTPVRVLWALLKVGGLSDAKRLLQIREGNVRHRHIGTWEPGVSLTGAASAIADWAEQQHLDGVVWTALPPKWADEDNRIPSSDDVVTYLATQDRDSAAAVYIRRTPAQIRTRYRTVIEATLGWLPE